MNEQIRERIEKLARETGLKAVVSTRQDLIEVLTIALTAFAEETEKPVEVIDLTKMQLITRAVNHPVKWERGTPRWSAVGAIFGLGSTSAQKLCKLCGHNPNDIKLRNGRIKLAEPINPPGE